MKHIGKISYWGVNCVLVGFLLARAIEINNDKVPGLFMIVYLVIISINLVVWGVLKFAKNRFSGSVGLVVLILLALFIPLLSYVIYL